MYIYIINFIMYLFFNLKIKGIVIIIILPMYYKSLRSRILFKNLTKNDNKILNKKFFYCEVKNKIYFSLKTKNEIITLNEKKKDKLCNFLYQQNLHKNIHYFENFSGYLMIVKFEGYSTIKDTINNIYPYTEGIFFYFFNTYSNYKNKLESDFVILTRDKIGIDMILLLLNNYLDIYEEVFNIDSITKEDVIDDFFLSYEEFENFNFLFRFEVILDYKYLITYIFDLKKLFLNRFSKHYYRPEYYSRLGIFSSLIKKYKCYINVKPKEFINLKKSRKDFAKLNLVKWFEYEEDYFTKFNGHVFLAELDILIDNRVRIKRANVFFIDIAKKDLCVFELYKLKNFCVITYIIENFLDDGITKINNVKTDCRGIWSDFAIRMPDRNMANTFFDSFDNLLYYENMEKKELKFSTIMPDKMTMKLLGFEDLNRLYFTLMYYHYISTV